MKGKMVKKVALAVGVGVCGLLLVSASMADHHVLKGLKQKQNIAPPTQSVFIIEDILSESIPAAAMKQQIKNKKQQSYRQSQMNVNDFFKAMTVDSYNAKAVKLEKDKQSSLGMLEKSNKLRPDELSF